MNADAPFESLRARSDTSGGGLKAAPAFSLRRFCCVSSLVGVLVVIAGLLAFNRYLALNALMGHETRSNVALTRAFANTHWPGYAPFVAGARELPRESLRERPENFRLREKILEHMKGLSIVKVKVYDLSGLTVFSTDPKQIGEDQSANAGFRSARDGVTTSDITFRENFDAFEQIISERNLLYSYIPIRAGDSAPVEGVFEVYSDVSDLVERLHRTQWQIVAAVLGSLGALYFFLYVVVGQAERIISQRSHAERLASQARLHHQAFHDPLTGLPNRSMLTERLNSAIGQARRSGRAFAVLFIDLDHFKTVNDSLGHVVGDDLLRAVAGRVVNCVREVDTVARIGGDEFVVLCQDLGRAEDAARLAEKLLRVISGSPYGVGGHQLQMQPSIGISLYPDDAQDAVALVRNADAAMYHAKESGRNNFQFFTADMNARAFAVLSMEHSLHQALARSEFVLHYQPQFDAAGAIVGIEALVRWRHPEMGMVPPGKFIPIAEERGLIVPIGEWVLREVCRQNRAWQQTGMPPVPVGVNVSALQFRMQDFPDKVAAVLRETGLEPQWLELEITESVIMHGAEAAIATLRRLKAMGVRLSIDDFGTGYSSLNYLKQFPIDRLKLDQSFVRGLPSSADDKAISTAVLDMARALKLTVVAEGVETEAQREFLFSQACDALQGYLFTRPLPAQDLESFWCKGREARESA